jgi:hypothetical protein
MEFTSELREFSKNGVFWPGCLGALQSYAEGVLRRLQTPGREAGPRLPGSTGLRTAIDGYRSSWAL